MCVRYGPSTADSFPRALFLFTLSIVALNGAQSNKHNHQIHLTIMCVFVCVYEGPEKLTDRRRHPTGLPNRKYLMYNSHATHSHSNKLWPADTCRRWWWRWWANDVTYMLSRRQSPGSISRGASMSFNIRGAAKHWTFLYCFRLLSYAVCFSLFSSSSTALTTQSFQTLILDHRNFEYWWWTRSTQPIVQQNYSRNYVEFAVKIYYLWDTVKGECLALRY